MIEEVYGVQFSELLSTDYVNKELTVNPYAHFLVYKINSKIVGYLYYSLIYDRLEINQIEVLEEYRHKGIGSKLLEFLIDNEPYGITLEVRKDNYNAINLYKKYNFVAVSIRKGYYSGVDGVLMERK